MIRQTTLRPGYLVSLKTKITGDNVDYQKTDIVEEHVTTDGQLIAEWNTQKTIVDAKEYEAALVVRNKARSLIVGICSRSEFGLLCPEDKVEALDRAVADATKAVADFNFTSRLTEVECYVVKGRIATDDQQAVRAINNEVRGLLAAMEDGIVRFDVKAIREAAGRAKKLGAMLTPEAQAKINETLTAVRSVATKINAAGEEAAQEVDDTVLAKLREARTSFLDLDDAAEIVEPAAEGRGVDLDPSIEDDLLGPAPTAAKAAELEFDDLM